MFLFAVLKVWCGVKLLNRCLIFMKRYFLKNCKWFDTFANDCKLVESTTWLIDRSSVDIMIIFLIAFDSTSIHDPTFVEQHVFNARLYFLVKKNCVKSVDFILECAENRTPKVGRASMRRKQEQCFLGSNTE